MVGGDGVLSAVVGDDGPPGESVVCKADVNDHKTRMAQRRNEAGEDGLMDSRPLSCA